MDFDYTKKANPDTLKPGALQGYRLVHWLADILRNWFSDPINLKDERLCRLLRLQDGDTETSLKALFDIGTPYSQDTKKACTTPMIIVGLGQTSYPVKNFNAIGSGPVAENGAIPMYTGMKYKTIDCQITVLTESYDGTLLLAGLIEDFLCINERLLAADNGMIAEFNVLGSTAPQELRIGAESNAKPIYQTVISIRTVGGLSWYADTQGPVFRGITTTSTLK